MVYFEVKRSVSGRYFWHICGENNKVLAASEEYESKQMCMKTVDLVRNEVKPDTEVKQEE